MTNIYKPLKKKKLIIYLTLYIKLEKKKSLNNFIFMSHFLK